MPPENPTHKLVTFRAKVPVYQGYEERCNIHHFHSTETQEVDLTGWYLPDKGTVELLFGVNLYTRFDMSENWVKALDTDSYWSHHLSILARTAYLTL